MACDMTQGIAQVISKGLLVWILRCVVNLTIRLHAVIACIHGVAVLTDTDALSFISQRISDRQGLLEWSFFLSYSVHGHKTPSKFYRCRSINYPTM